MATRRRTCKIAGGAKLKVDEIIICGSVLLNEPMNRRTSLKVGGLADMYIIPENVDDLRNLLDQLRTRRIPWLAVGKGNNLLVRDSGIRGAVISLERFNQLNVVDERRIRAGSGSENLALVRFAQKHGLGGIAFIAGVPGSIGGAVRMNAGAYGTGIMERIESLTMFSGGVVMEIPKEELDYGYRYFNLQKDDLILAALFRLENQLSEETEDEIRKDVELRRSKHSVGFPSAGSFFKNPRGQSAWRLIDAAGMRGAMVGGAQVSRTHSNFLVNTGSATAKDFLELSRQVKKAVLATSGVTLEEEVRIVGEEKL